MNGSFYKRGRMAEKGIGAFGCSLAYDEKEYSVATKKNAAQCQKVLRFFFIQVRDQGNPVTDADHAVPGFFQVCRYAAKQVFFYTPDHIQDSTLQQPFQKQSEHQIRSAALKTS